MSEEKKEKLIDESIQLELNVAELYEIFSNRIAEDRDFWWQLHLEERSHAILLRAAKDSFVKRGMYPSDLLLQSGTLLEEANKRVTEVAEQCKTETLTREKACLYAIELEQTAGERHFEAFMTRDPNDSVESVFQQLNRQDKDHEQRIRDHLDKVRNAA